MPSSTPPNVNVLELASDDDIWVIQTDLATLQIALADPAGFVRDHVKIQGQPGHLVEPFVIVFHEIPRSPNGPDVLIQGINHTAMVTVKYASDLEAEDDGIPIFPEDEEHMILRHGDAVYTHLQFSDMDRAAVANSLVKILTRHEHHYSSLNKLRQTVRGRTLPDEEKHVFMRNTEHPTQIIYQGATDPPAQETMNPGDPAPKTPICDLSTGDANGLGQVIVNGVIIKTYTK